MSQRPVPREPLCSCNSLFKLLLRYLEDITVSSSNNQDSSQKTSLKIIILNVMRDSESKIKDFRKKVYTHCTVRWVQGLCNLHLKNHLNFNSIYLYVNTSEIGIQRHYPYEFNDFQIGCRLIDAQIYLLTTGFEYHTAVKLLFFLFKFRMLMLLNIELINELVLFKITTSTQLKSGIINVLLLIVIQVPPLAQLCGPYGGDSWKPVRKPVYMEVTVYMSLVGVRTLQSVLTQSIVLIYEGNKWRQQSDISISLISGLLLVNLLFTVTLVSNYIVYLVKLQNKLNVRWYTNFFPYQYRYIYTVNVQGYTQFFPCSFLLHCKHLISFIVTYDIRCNLSDDCVNNNFRIFRCILKLSSLLLTFLLKGWHRAFCAIYTTVSWLSSFLEWRVV